MAILSLNAGNFNETVTASTVPVLVDFYADWCQPCKHLTPVLEEIAAESDGKYLICKVNIDENKSLAAHYSVMSIPYLVSFKDGQVHKQTAGVRPKSELLAMLT